jgi:hypothetical protein
MQANEKQEIRERQRLAEAFLKISPEYKKVITGFIFEIFGDFSPNLPIPKIHDSRDILQWMMMAIAGDPLQLILNAFNAAQSCHSDLVGVLTVVHAFTGMLTA